LQDETRSLRLSIGDDLEEFRKIFEGIDIDGNGVLDVYEIAEALGIPFERFATFTIHTDTDFWFHWLLFALECLSMTCIRLLRPQMHGTHGQRR
jgi:hypothetical protein